MPSKFRSDSKIIDRFGVLALDRGFPINCNQLAAEHLKNSLALGAEPEKGLTHAITPNGNDVTTRTQFP